MSLHTNKGTHVGHSEYREASLCQITPVMPPLSPKYFFILLGVSEIALAVFKRAGSSTKTEDGGSFFALWGVIGASIYCAIRITFVWPQFAFMYSDVLYWLAVVFFLGGSFFRWWSIIHLGRFFTVNVALAKDHRVVDDGPYRYVRHPSYTGVFVAFTGLGLMLFNWMAALVMVVPVVAVFLWRMTVEERALLQGLGADYNAYMGRTKRVVPFVY